MLGVPNTRAATPMRHRGSLRNLSCYLTKQNHIHRPITTNSLRFERIPIFSIYILLTIVVTETLKLPFFVGAPGFSPQGLLLGGIPSGEPGTSWSRRSRQLRNHANVGQFCRCEFSGVHPVSQSAYKLLTVTKRGELQIAFKS
jgi:hypothetical protein